MTTLEIILSIVCMFLYVFGAWFVALIADWEASNSLQLLFIIFWPLAVIYDVLLDLYYRMKNK